jgi:hypothetical protein
VAEPFAYEQYRKVIGPCGGFFVVFFCWSIQLNSIQFNSIHWGSQARIESILEEGTARRFELKKAARDLPKVNRMLAKKLLASQEKEDTRRQRVHGADAVRLCWPYVPFLINCRG